MFLLLIGKQMRPQSLDCFAPVNDTEFLNVDDEEVAEITDDYMPHAEESRLTENSGWSSRTRCCQQNRLSNMDRSWIMLRSRLDKRYQDGLRNFLAFACDNIPDGTSTTIQPTLPSSLHQSLCQQRGTLYSNSFLRIQLCKNIHYRGTKGWIHPVTKKKYVMKLVLSNFWNLTRLSSLNSIIVLTICVFIVGIGIDL